MWHLTVTVLAVYGAANTVFWGYATWRMIKGAGERKDRRNVRHPS
jgi:hypothetical protein